MTGRAISHQEELSHLCEACHLGQGVRFADRRWVCEACAQYILGKLLAEPLQPRPPVKVPTLPQAVIDRIWDWRKRA
jgi:ribosomal protein L37AE/L43A